MPGMHLAGIHHVAIIASDYARSKRFYVGVLGLQVVAEAFREARGSWKLDLRLADGTQVELFSFPAPPPRVSRPEACGLRHLAFRVDDLDAALAHLQAHGVRIGDFGSRYGAEGEGPSQYLFDPEGNLVELKGRPATN